MSLKASEGIMEDNIIYVTKQGSKIRVSKGRIKVTKGSDTIADYPSQKIDTVNLFGGVNFTTPFISLASEEGISLNYFSKYGKYKGSFIPVKNTIAEVRKKQYGLSKKDRVSISKDIVIGKIKNSMIFLKRKNTSDLDKLENIISRCKKCTDLEVLRGLEGEAAEYYFRKLDNTFIDGWSFKKRTKRPPEDHINSLMSLTYVMMKNEVVSALRQYNLDPFMGIMHKDRHGRPALALDLLEELRSIFCDAFSTRLVNRKTIVHKDFKKNNRLKNDAFNRYLDKFEDYMQEEFNHPEFDYTVNRRKSIRMQAIILRKKITREYDKYHPMVFKR